MVNGKDLSGKIRLYALQDGLGSTSAVLMQALGTDFLPVTINAIYDGGTVTLTGSASVGYTAALGTGLSIASTLDGPDDSIHAFTLSDGTTTTDLGTWQWQDGRWSHVIGGDDSLEELSTPWTVKERYVYDPHGLTTVLKGDWNAYDMTGGVAYGNDPKNGWNESDVDFRWMYGQQRWFSGDRLYHTARGSYDPILGASAQPRVDAASLAFKTNGWWDDFSYSLGAQFAQTVSGLTRMANPLMMMGAVPDPLAGLNPSVIPGSGYDANMDAYHTDDVGFGEGLIPVWGNAKQAYIDFGRGDLMLGIANSYLAAQDATGFGYLGKTLGQVVLKSGRRIPAAIASRKLLRAANDSVREKPFTGGLDRASDVFGPVLTKMFKERGIGDFQGIHLNRMTKTQFSDRDLAIYFQMERHISGRVVGEEVQHAIDFAQGATRKVIQSQFQRIGAGDLNDWWHRRVFTRQIQNIHSGRFGMGVLSDSIGDVYRRYQNAGGRLPLEEILKRDFKTLY